MIYIYDIHILFMINVPLVFIDAIDARFSQPSPALHGNANPGDDPSGRKCMKSWGKWLEIFREWVK